MSTRRAPADVRVVGDGRGADKLDALVAGRAAIEVVEQSLAPAEEEGDDMDLHLVDQAGSEVLLGRARAPAE
jgi:hypothetical protein